MSWLHAECGVDRTSEKYLICASFEIETDYSFLLLLRFLCFGGKAPSALDVL